MMCTVPRQQPINISSACFTDFYLFALECFGLDHLCQIERGKYLRLARHLVALQSQGGDGGFDLRPGACTAAIARFEAATTPRTI